MIDYTPEPDVYMTRNQPLKFIVMDLWETPLAQISFPENLDQANYDVVARVRQPRVNYCGRSSGKRSKSGLDCGLKRRRGRCERTL